MKPFITIFALLLLSSWCKAQTASVTDANASMHSTSTGIVACTYTIVLSDTTISNIEIKLGTSSGSDNLLVQDIAFDNVGSLPQGWTYTRAANTITIGAGEYAESNIYFGEVRLKNNGSWGSPFQFIAN